MDPGQYLGGPAQGPANADEEREASANAIDDAPAWPLLKGRVDPRVIARLRIIKRKHGMRHLTDAMRAALDAGCEKLGA